MDYKTKIILGVVLVVFGIVFLVVSQIVLRRHMKRSAESWTDENAPRNY